MRKTWEWRHRSIEKASTMMKLTNLAGEAEESLELMIEKQVDVGDKMRECQEQIVSVMRWGR